MLQSSLVLSLWPVSNRAARELMTDFYDGWASGLTKSAALGRARLRMLGRGDSPADWGAFILVGNPD